MHNCKNPLTCEICTSFYKGTRKPLISKAYLMVRLEIIGHNPIPQVTAVQISSQPAGSMAAGIWAGIMELEGSGFADAKHNLLTWMEQIPAMKPYLFWLKDGFKAHCERYGLDLAINANRSVGLEDNSAYVEPFGSF